MHELILRQPGRPIKARIARLAAWVIEVAVLVQSEKSGPHFGLV